MSKLKARRAFTLVELLVVIGIIAVLIAILMPALTAARQQANRAKCQSNLRQIYLSLQAYANDSKGWIPQPVGHDSAYDPADPTKHINNNTERPKWIDYLYYRRHMIGGPIQYITNPQIFACPGYPRQLSGGSLYMNYGLNNRMFRWNTINSMPRWITVVKGFGWNRSGDIHFYRLMATRQPSEMYLVADSSMDGSSGVGYLDNLAQNWPRFANHKKAANMLYHDGHVGTVERNEIEKNTVSGKRDIVPWRNTKVP